MRPPTLKVDTYDDSRPQARWLLCLQQSGKRELVEGAHHEPKNTHIATLC